MFGFVDKELDSFKELLSGSLHKAILACFFRVLWQFLVTGEIERPSNW